MQQTAVLREEGGEEVADAPYTEEEVARFRKEMAEALVKKLLDHTINRLVGFFRHGHPEVLEVAFVEKVLRTRLDVWPQIVKPQIYDNIKVLANWLKAQPGFNTQRLMRQCPRPRRNKFNHPYANAVREAFLAS